MGQGAHRKARMLKARELPSKWLRPGHCFRGLSAEQPRAKEKAAAVGSRHFGGQLFARDLTAIALDL